MPDDILQPEAMATVLVDIHIAEAAIERDRLQGDTASMHKAKQFYKEIFAHHTITEGEFKKSFDYYQYHPEQFEAIYADVIERLSRLEGEATAAQGADTTGE